MSSQADATLDIQAAIAALGEEHPGLDTFSWVTRTELTQVAALIVETGARVVDLGCGHGGPGLWIAGMTGSRLTGVDIDEAALVVAREHARMLGVDASFRRGSFQDTGLADAAADLVVSFDSLLFASDKPAAFAEMRRILRPGGLLAMTSWDYCAQPRNRPPQVADHRPLVRAAGLSVRSYDETVDWRHRCVTYADFLLDRVDELAVQRGRDPEVVREGVQDMRDSMDLMIRRFLLIAQRIG